MRVSLWSREWSHSFDAHCSARFIQMDDELVQNRFMTAHLKQIVPHAECLRAQYEMQALVTRNKET